MKRFSATVLALLAVTLQSHADEAAIVTYEVDASFEDASLNVQDAIINRGLVVDYVARVGDMLNRTADDVGAEQKVYASADVHIFCSATLSRKMMEADVTNVGHCPYGIFVYTLADHPETTYIGYRRMPAGVMSEVENLLDEIAREAAEID
jgi:hypothetical protein